MRQAGGSKRDRFLKVCDAKKLHLFRDGLAYTNHPVSIGVCFYHHEDFSPANSFADDGEIVEERIPIDLGPASICLF